MTNTNLYQIQKRHTSGFGHFGYEFVVLKHGATVYTNKIKAYCESYVTLNTPENMPELPNSVYVGGSTTTNEYASITAHFDGQTVELPLTRGQIADVISGLSSILARSN